MKDLAIDESLSEEARDSAKKALEVLVSSQLLDIEQAAALKKLESEADFVHQQAQIEALAKAKAAEVEVKEMVAEAQSTRDKADAKKLLQAAQDLVVSDDMMDWLGQHRLQQCAADLARIAGPYAQPPSFYHVVSPDRSGVWWSCCMCRTVLPSDLQYLTDEDVEEIGVSC